MTTSTRRLALSIDRALATGLDPSRGQRRELDPRLHEYQVRAVQHLQDHPRAVLMLDMGLGKTATVLQSLTPDHLPALVVAPKRITEHVWGPEARLWRPELSVGICVGSPAKRQEVLDQEHDIYVISKENSHQVKPGRFKTLVLDELSRWKNPSTKGFKVAKRLAETCPNVWGLTGTPAPNGYPDLWGQIYLIDRGVRLKRTVTAFRSKWLYPAGQLPSGVVTKWKLRDFAKDDIDGLLSDICLSMKSSDYLDMREPVLNPIRIELPPKVQKIYKDMETGFVVDAQDDGVFSAGTAAAAQNKLSQITAGFIYPDSDEVERTETLDLHDLKYQAVLEVVEGTGSPVLVFYRFKHERDRLLELVPESELATDKGVIDRFAKGEVRVMLAHPASMAHGLNLQKNCHTVVWSTLPWSSEEWSQANARVDRQGQTSQVVIHLVVASGTVDEAIKKAVDEKISIQDSLMTALSGGVMKVT